MKSRNRAITVIGAIFVVIIGIIILQKKLDISTEARRADTFFLHLTSWCRASAYGNETVDPEEMIEGYIGEVKKNLPKRSLVVQDIEIANGKSLYKIEIEKDGDSHIVIITNLLEDVDDKYRDKRIKFTKLVNIEGNKSKIYFLGKE